MRNISVEENTEILSKWNTANEIYHKYLKNLSLDSFLKIIHISVYKYQMITEENQEYSPERHTAPLLLETMALIDNKR